MAGFSIRTDLDPEAALTTVRRIARDLGFGVRIINNRELSVRKGSLIASIGLGGAFIAYCNFRLFIEPNAEGAVEISVERNSPWWTGTTGLNRVHNQAQALADAIEKGIVADGGKVLKRGTF